MERKIYEQPRKNIPDPADLNAESLAEEIKVKVENALKENNTRSFTTMGSVETYPVIEIERKKLFYNLENDRTLIKCEEYEEELNNEPISLEEFNNCDYKRETLKLHQLDEKKINSLFKNNRDIMLVTDKIKNYKLLSKKFNFKERIIPESFSLFSYLNARLNGFENVLFPYKRYNFIYKHLFGINLITVSYSDFVKNKKKITKLFQNGTNIFVYTSNDENFIIENINKTITGVYVDFWDIANQKCISNLSCKNY